MVHVTAKMAKKKSQRKVAAARRRNKRAETEKRLRAAFDEIKRTGQPTGPSAFAEIVGVHRTYLYSFPSLIAELSEYGRKTQPGISKRGKGVSKPEAKKRELDAKVRQEHARWAKEIPELRGKVDAAEKRMYEQDREIKQLREQLERLRGLYEYLLMLASEAGVSPTELELIESKVPSSISNK